ncbi:BhlA/UviB family holin-like peptide [Brevibacillus daliensis]|uniref:BhlA/UviB family holin-like peptide n=1 Tax=Brevibacillus daliensis TaxID=2892995 RepID=UPI001E4D7536|nr:BhlA/UviB family holin-like peptide [Brevibacillus daliensis]
MGLDESVFKLLLQQGPYAALFIWLLFYVIRTNKERENRLQDLLDKFSDKYDLIISELRDLKNRVHK